MPRICSQQEHYILRSSVVIFDRNYYFNVTRRHVYYHFTYTINGIVGVRYYLKHPGVIAFIIHKPMYRRYTVQLGI